MAEVQFLDNLRRGASINYADLQPNPVPANLGEAYRLLSVIAPQARMLLAAPVAALLGGLLSSCNFRQQVELPSVACDAATALSHSVSGQQD